MSEVTMVQSTQDPTDKNRARIWNRPFKKLDFPLNPEDFAGEIQPHEIFLDAKGPILKRIKDKWFLIKRKIRETRNTKIKNRVSKVFDLIASFFDSVSDTKIKKKERISKSKSILEQVNKDYPNEEISKGDETKTVAPWN